MSAKQPLAIQRAQELRAKMTAPEKKLWLHLREQKKIFGKFRRQEPVDCYIADFISSEHRLIIELDGSNHIPENDNARDKYLSMHNFRVLRFSNQDVMQNVQMVLDNIYLAVAASPTPDPSRKGRGAFVRGAKSLSKENKE